MRYLHNLPISIDRNTQPLASVGFNHYVLIVFEKLIEFIKCEAKIEKKERKTENADIGCACTAFTA
jgi:hypothetical protein